MMKAGTYYIGDLCYVMHDCWDEFCNVTISGGDVKDGEFQLKNGVKFATYRTKYGDGTYSDQYGHEYGVDAGLIGCILVSDIAENAHNDVKLGNVVTFDYDFVTGEEDGLIIIGNYRIETGEEYSDSDYYGDAL